MLDGGQVYSVTTVDLFIDVDPFIDAEIWCWWFVEVIVDLLGDILSL